MNLGATGSSMPSSRVDNDAGKVVQILAQESSEEKLMNNPIIQKMMEKFFMENSKMYSKVKKQVGMKKR